jgi:hypothetical protein
MSDGAKALYPEILGLDMVPQAQRSGVAAALE